MSTTQHPPSLPPPVSVGVVDTPIDLASGVTLDRVVALATERHPLRAGEGGSEPTAQDREVHAREMRREASLAYAGYLSAWRMQRTAQHHAETASVAARLVATEVRGGAMGEADADRLAIECARVDMSSVHTGWELDRARAGLNALLARPADATVGPPGDETARSVALPIDDLVARAGRHHPIDPHDAEAPLILRGQIEEVLDQLQQLEREWSVLHDEALPHVESLERSLHTPAAVMRDALGTSLAVAQELADVEGERSSLLAELIVAVADLEQAVGEPLPATPLGAQPAAPPAAAAPAAAPAAH